MGVLEGLWSTPEAEPAVLPIQAALAGEASAEQLQHLWGVPGETPAYEDFELDHDHLPGSAAPNPTARFQMGRQDPPVRHFSRELNPLDAEVVSQRDASGHFQAVDRPRPAPTAPRPASARPVRQTGPASARAVLPPAGAPQAAVRAMAALANVQPAPIPSPAPAGGVPSRYQRLRQPSNIKIDD